MKAERQVNGTGNEAGNRGDCGNRAGATLSLLIPSDPLSPSVLVKRLAGSKATNQWWQIRNSWRTGRDGRNGSEGGGCVFT
jgi:hypothetical protein